MESMLKISSGVIIYFWRQLEHGKTYKTVPLLSTGRIEIDMSKRDFFEHARIPLINLWSTFVDRHSEKGGILRV